MPCRHVGEWKYDSTFPDLSSRGGWVVSFTDLPPYPSGNKLPVPSGWEAGWTPQSGHCGVKKHLALPGNEPGPSAIPTELSQLQNFYIWKKKQQSHHFSRPSLYHDALIFGQAGCFSKLSAEVIIPRANVYSSLSTLMHRALVGAIRRRYAKEEDPENRLCSLIGHWRSTKRLVFCLTWCDSDFVRSNMEVYFLNSLFYVSLKTGFMIL